jgi:hypothetical protein
MRVKTAHPASAGGPRGFWSFNGAWLGGVLIALVVASTHLSAQQRLRVIPVVKGDYLEVSFELRDGLTPEVLAAIDSGLKTTFTYNVDLRLDPPGWFDRTVGNAVITNSVAFDNLQRKHTLERTVNGREQDSLVTTDPAVVRKWMTNVQDLPLFRTRLLLRNREYYVRVNASARPSYGSVLWPFGSGTSAQTKFIFR